MVTVNDRIYALGGSSKRGVTNSVERLDGNAEQWTSVKPMLCSRYGLVAVSVQVSQNLQTSLNMHI
jgi:hypothetical protein